VLLRLLAQHVECGIGVDTVTNMRMPLVCSIRARLAVIASTASEIRSSSRRLRALSPGSFGPSGALLRTTSSVASGVVRRIRVRHLCRGLGQWITQPKPGAMGHRHVNRELRLVRRSRARPRRHRPRRASEQSDRKDVHDVAIESHPWRAAHRRYDGPVAYHVSLGARSLRKPDPTDVYLLTVG
jgi:hypothetical protein